jgi:hypothetical protein
MTTKMKYHRHLTTEKKEGQLVTRAIANKGFVGNRRSSPVSSFRVG